MSYSFKDGLLHCRGDEDRGAFIRDYHVNVLHRGILLEGEEKKSCAGDKIENEYYIFSYKKINSTDLEGTFYAGSYVASKFIKALEMNKPPLINPLKALTNGISGGGNDVIEDCDDNYVNPIKKELSMAIALILAYRKKSINNTLLEIMKKVISKDDNFDNEIKGINTYILKMTDGRGISYILTKLKEKNNMKEITFQNINNRINDNNFKRNPGFISYFN